MRTAVPRVLVEPALAMLFWSVVFTVAKVSMAEIPAFTFAVARMLVAGLLLLAFAAVMRMRSAGPMPWRLLVVVGVAQLSFQTLFMQGIDRTSPGVSAVLLSTSPLISAAWLTLGRRQRFAGLQWLGLVTGVLGVGLVVGSNGLVLGSLIGNLIALGAAAAWAWYSLVVGPLARAIGPMPAATGSLLVGGVLLLPFMVPQAAAVDWSSVSPGAWAGFAYSASVGLAAATALWVRGVNRYGAQAAINYQYAQPVAAVAIAGLLIGQTLQPMQALGAVLALAGVFLASGPPRSPGAPRVRPLSAP